jgi:hypothetical protein
MATWRADAILPVALGCLVLVGNVSCGGSSPSATDTTTSLPSLSTAAPTVPIAGAIDELKAWVQGSLQSLSGQLRCPPAPPTPIFLITLPRNAPVLYCKSPVLTDLPTTPPSKGMAIQARNTGSVPIRIGHGPYGLVLQYGPGQDFQFPLPQNPRPSTDYAFQYSIDPDGMAYVIAQQLLAASIEPPIHIPGIISLGECVLQLTAKCVTSNIAKYLPETVRIGRYQIPLRTLGTVISDVMSYAPLVQEWANLQGPGSTGTIHITYLGTG